MSKNERLESIEDATSKAGWKGLIEIEVVDTANFFESVKLQIGYRFSWVMSQTLK